MTTLQLIEQYTGKIELDWNHLHNRKVQITLICGAVTLYYVYKRLTRKKYKLPPGPTPLPLVGNLLSSGVSNLHLQYQEYSKKYGPVFTFHLGPTRAVILNNLDVMKEAFVTKGLDFAGRPKSLINDLFTDNGKDIVFGQYGPLWKVQRKIAHAALRKYTSGDKVNVLLKNSFDIMTKEIDKELQKGPVSVAEWNLNYIYNVFSTLCFGRIFELDDPFFVKLKKEIMSLADDSEVLFIADAFPFILNFYELKAVKKFKQLSKDIVGTFEVEYMKHEISYDPANLTDFMYDLIDLKKKAESDKETSHVMKEMTTMHFLMICLDLFFAGTDTTRITMSFVMMYAAKYPDMQQKIQDEIEDVIGDNTDFNVRAKDALHYLHAFLYETMRINPVTYIGIPHRAVRDTQIGEYDIPKDTMIIANQWGIQHDESALPDHDQFRPDRWLREDGTFDHQSCPFVPFSMGTRVCVGEALAKVEIMMSLALFFQKYTFKVPDGMELDMGITEVVGGIEPKPFKLEIIPRY